MSTIGYLDAVNDALERLDDLGYERGSHGDLANHGPMGAEAVALLGHPDSVAGWVQGYRAGMEHHDPPRARFGLDPADEASWREALGVFDRAGDWERLFAIELAGAPWREVLARWWPRLLPGLLAGLTHGLIRTAHAVRSLSATGEPTPAQLTELARGLAYWAARYHPVPGRASFTGEMDVAGAISAMPRTPFAESGPGPRLTRPDTLPGYTDGLTALAAEQGEPQALLGELTLRFAEVYLRHPEVFPVPLIHGVTAPAAARLVLPHLPAHLHGPTAATLWQVNTVLLLSFTGDRGAEGRTLTAREAARLPTFDELAGLAIEHGDEHVIKFTEACRREYALRPDPVFPAAADAARRRIDRAAIARM